MLFELPLWLFMPGVVFYVVGVVVFVVFNETDLAEVAIIVSVVVTVTIKLIDCIILVSVLGGKSVVSTAFAVVVALSNSYCQSKQGFFITRPKAFSEKLFNSRLGFQVAFNCEEFQTTLAGPLSLT